AASGGSGGLAVRGGGAVTGDGRRGGDGQQAREPRRSVPQSVVPNRTRRVSSSAPVRCVSGPYSSGRLARIQRRPEEDDSSDASRSAITRSSPTARDSPTISP